MKATIINAVFALIAAETDRLRKARYLRGIRRILIDVGVSPGDEAWVTLYEDVQQSQRDHPKLSHERYDCEAAWLRDRVGYAASCGHADQLHDEADWAQAKADAIEQHGSSIRATAYYALLGERPGDTRRRALKLAEVV